MGLPAEGYPWRWSVYHWLAGEHATPDRIADMRAAATWARGRGWTLWKALITLVPADDGDSPRVERARRVIDELLAEHDSAPRL
jgi:aminoglycoside phosphotransferase (APT) family kinase protein